MRIKKIEAIPIKLKLKKTFKTAIRQTDCAQNVIIKIFTDEGLVGIGEAATPTRITGETQESVLAVINNIISPLLSGSEVFDIERMMEKIDSHVVGNTCAKAGIDIALHDLLGKTCQKPLYKLLGGYRNFVETDHTVSLDTPEKMAEVAETLVRKGFNILKVKLGLDPERDIQRVKAVRKRIGDQIILRVDANQAWSPKEAVKIIKSIEESNVELVEQPVKAGDIEGLKYVKNRVEVPIMADESVFSIEDALRLIKREAVDIINIKLMKSGGIYSARKIISIAEAAGIECMIGCMIESRIGVLAAVHLACGAKNITRVDLDGAMFLQDDIVIGGIKPDVGIFKLDESHGIGIKDVQKV